MTQLMAGDSAGDPISHKHVPEWAGAGPKSQAGGGTGMLQRGKPCSELRPLVPAFGAGRVLFPVYGLCRRSLRTRGQRLGDLSLCARPRAVLLKWQGLGYSRMCPEIACFGGANYYYFFYCGKIHMKFT